MKNIAATAFQYGIRILAIDVLLVVIVCVALALIEHSLDSFGNWLFWAGMITLVIGLMAVVGGAGVSRSGSYLLGQTTGGPDIVSRTNADLKEEAMGFSFLILATGAGVVAIAISRLF